MSIGVSCKTNKTPQTVGSKIDVPTDVRNSESENMTKSGEIGLTITTNASPKCDRTMCPGKVDIMERNSSNILHV